MIDESHIPLSHDQASEKLEAMKAAYSGASKAPKDPKTPAEASARLNELKSIEGWTALYLSGSGPHVADFNKLQELISSGDAIDLAIAGVYEDKTFQDKAHMDNMRTADFLRGSGIDDPAVLRQVLSNEKVSPQEFEAAKSMKARLMRDLEFTKRYLANDGEAVRQIALLNVVLTREVKTEAA